ncbi:MAG: hypothetical protein LBJ42_01745 [Holosporales bacterium]|nr:hypothetical protein [Holosporales bacterium]
MAQFRTTNFAIAKLCHEMANRLGVISFLREDLADKAEELAEFFSQIDLLTHVMSFFREIYSVSETTSDLIKIVLNIAKLNGINAQYDEGIICKISTMGSLRFFAGILYMLLKVCKPGDTVVITEDRRIIAVTIDAPRRLHNAVCAALNDESVAEDVFNTFALHVKALANRQGIKISTDLSEYDAARVNIWRG